MSADKQTTSRFTVLWLKAQPVLTGYVVSLVRDRAAVDDLIQSVALTAIEKIEQYDESRSFEAWVIGIARYSVLQYYRETGRQTLVFNEALINEFSEHYIATSEGYDDRVTALRQCMSNMPDDARDLLNRRYFDRQSVREIAEQLGLVPQRISKRLFNIRKALERCIDQQLAKEGGAS